ncbi:MAG: hypothetical protein AAGK66_02760 [Pseudomonadota bacterium]
MDLSFIVLFVFLGLALAVLAGGAMIAAIGLCRGHTKGNERRFDPALGIWR